MILCWSAKGGSGTTVVAAALSLVLTGTAAPGALAVDLAGDLPAVLGAPEPGGPGVLHWLAADPPADDESLRGLVHELAGGIGLLHTGSAPAPVPAGAWARLAAALDRLDRPVVVDAGCRVPPPDLRAIASASLLVLRPCYLALRRAVSVAHAATGVVLLTEHGRALGSHDVEAALGLPVVVELPIDPAVARAVDAGLLAGRLPGTLARNLAAVA